MLDERVELQELMWPLKSSTKRILDRDQFEQEHREEIVSDTYEHGKKWMTCFTLVVHDDCTIRGYDGSPLCNNGSAVRLMRTTTRCKAVKSRQEVLENLYRRYSPRRIYFDLLLVKVALLS